MHFQIGNSRLRSIAISNRGLQSALGVRIIQCGEKLALFGVIALVEKDAGDTPGDLGGNRRAPARGDVAAGIEQGFRLRAAGGRAAATSTAGIWLRKANMPPAPRTSTPKDAAKIRQNFPPEPLARAESAILSEDKSAGAI